MRMVVQRVVRAEVRVGGSAVAGIGRGFLVLLGVFRDDGEADAEWLAERLPKLRVFDDPEGKMNRDLLEVDGEVLVVSQFTLYGTVRKGNRPSYNRAAGPDRAVPLYERFAAEVSRRTGRDTPTGRFG